MYANDFYKEFADEIKKLLSYELREKTVTIAEQLRNRGTQQAKYMIARSMLLDKSSIKMVHKYTALSVKELKKLKAELEPMKN